MFTSLANGPSLWDITEALHFFAAMGCKFHSNTSFTTVKVGYSSPTHFSMAIDILCDIQGESKVDML